MPATINTNLISLNAQRNLYSSQSTLATAMQRLSSGLRVNSAKDDSAGLAIAERMNSQVRGSAVALRNANDAISLAQTAEGALGKIGESLQRMRELAVQAANATNSASDKANLQMEYGELASEVSRVINATTFNSTPLLNTGATLTFQIGAENNTANQATVTTADLTTSPGITAALAGDLTTGATTAMDDVAAAIDEISEARATFGASQNRFESIISMLQTTMENQAASRGRIMDADFAVETSNLARAQILQQAGSAMVAQANAIPNQVLQLLKG